MLRCQPSLGLLKSPRDTLNHSEVYRLVILKSMSMVSLIQRINSRPYPRNSTPGNVEAVVFYGSNSRFSNHYKSNFVWDNKTFSTIEQYLAFRRALIAGRRDLANKTMSSEDPALAKRILNELRNAPTEDKWIEQRHDILYSGLNTKFSQNEDLLTHIS